MKKDNPNTTFIVQKNRNATVRGIVHSSYGEIEIDLTTGKVTDVYSEDNSWRDYTLNQISKFDLDEYRKYYNDLEGEDTEFDILDIGFWEKDRNQFYPPGKQFRKERLKEINKVV